MILRSVRPIINMFVLKGREKVQLDMWGRFRLPADFLKICKEEFENEVFITSTDDRTLKIYRLAAWHARSTSPLRRKSTIPCCSGFS